MALVIQNTVKNSEFTLYPDFLSESESNLLFNRLTDQLQWNEENIKMYGKSIKVPRLVCWYGDTGTDYRYSGITHTALPWTRDLLEVKERIENHTGKQFNSVLSNLYRNENDSMGWHSDNEKELGSSPCIASLSLGEERLFKIRHKQSGETLDTTLNNGSLLVMSGESQNNWKHCVPKTKHKKGPRINLTFRYIFSSDNKNQ